MKCPVLWLLAGMLLLAGSCVYSDDGVYRVDPVPGLRPVFSVTTSLDTVSEAVVADSLRVTYLATIENGEFYQAEVYLEGSGIHLSDSLEGSFWLRPAQVELPGIKTLSIYFFYSTNSNSLADIVGAEAFNEQRDYQVRFLYGGLP